MDMFEMEKIRANIRVLLTRFIGDGEGLVLRLTGYEKVSYIPADKLLAVKRNIESELRCIQLMGDERYKASRSYADKIEIYHNALDEMLGQLMDRCGENDFCSWNDFKNLLAKIILNDEIGKHSAAASGEVTRQQEAACESGCGC